jgi:hypothetical protein
MATTSNVQVTISLSDPDLDDQELQAEVENLLPQVREVDGVEQADLVSVTETPRSAKAFGGFLWGVLSAEIKPANITALFGFLSDRFGNKPIIVALKTPDGRELKVQAGSRKEFEFAMQQAQDFLNNTKNTSNSNGEGSTTDRG